MLTGTVDWFDPAKGYGFIIPGDGSDPVFVPAIEVDRAGMATLNPGQAICYALGTGYGRVAAILLSLPGEI